MAIIAYTDGSSLGNPGPGGFGTILVETKMNFRKEFSDGYRLTTNNRMELMAVITALEKLKYPDSEITIYTDSQYIVNAVEKKWVFGWEKKAFKNKKNEDLWRIFLRLYRQHKVSLVWVKGHAGNELNEQADRLAVKAANSPNLKIDTFFENQNQKPNLFNS